MHYYNNVLQMVTLLQMLQIRTLLQMSSLLHIITCLQKIITCISFRHFTHEYLYYRCQYVFFFTHYTHIGYLFSFVLQMGAGIPERGQSGSGCFSGLPVLYPSCHEVKLAPVNCLLPLMYYDGVKLSPANSLLTYIYSIRLGLIPVCSLQILMY